MFTALQALLNSLAVTFDLPILDWIQAHLQCTFLDVTMPIVTLFGDGGVFWIAVAVVLLLFAKYRKTGFSMGMALVLGLLVCNILLKPQVARIRPYNFQLQEYGREITLLVKGLNDYSFPSGHTIASFEACTVLMLHDKRLASRPPFSPSSLPSPGCISMSTIPLTFWSAWSWVSSLASWEAILWTRSTRRRFITESTP